MKWMESIDINANLETVWALFDRHNLKRIMPQITHIKKISSDDSRQITVYEETYREGKREETYLLTEQIMADNALEKTKIFDFTIAKMIHSKGQFTLQKIDDLHTRFIYSGENTGISPLVRVMLRFSGTKSNNKVVFDFLHRVKEEAEKSQTL